MDDHWRIVLADGRVVDRDDPDARPWAPTITRMADDLGIRELVAPGELTKAEVIAGAFARGHCVGAEAMREAVAARLDARAAELRELATAYDEDGAPYTAVMRREAADALIDEAATIRGLPLPEVPRG